MRSLEEWQKYVEQQIEAARRRKSGITEETVAEEAVAEEAATPTAVATITEAAPDVPEILEPVEAAEPSPAEQRRTEGRALLTWQDTSPIQKSPTPKTPPPYVPPVRDRLSPASEADAPPPILKDALRSEAPPTAEPAPTQEKAASAPAPSETQEAPAPESPVRESRTPPPADESEIIPLRPYQPKDPRWQSSVTPPRNLNPRTPPKWYTPPTPAPAVEKAEVTPSTLPQPLSPEAPAPEPEAAPTAELVMAVEEITILEEAVPEMEAAAPAEAPEVVSATVVTITATPVQEEVTTAPQEADATSLTADTEAAPRKRGKRAKRLTAKKAESLPPPMPETPEQLQELWDRVPRHVQALIRTQNDEVAQRSYQSFKESREELICRLLDPELSLEEAARILAVCPTTVRRYTNRGLLPHHRTPGNQRRFRLSHVLEFTERFGQTLEGDQARERTDDNDANGSSEERTLTGAGTSSSPAS